MSQSQSRQMGLKLALPYFFIERPNCVDVALSGPGQYIEELKLTFTSAALKEDAVFARRDFRFEAPVEAKVDFLPGTTDGTVKLTCKLEVASSGLRQIYTREGAIRVREKPKSDKELNVYVDASINASELSEKAMFGGVVEGNKNVLVNANLDRDQSLDEKIDNLPPPAFETVPLSHPEEEYSDRLGDGELRLVGINFEPKFPMGTPDENPNKLADETLRHVRFSNHGLWIGSHPIGQALYQNVMGSNPAELFGRESGQMATHPVQRVSWGDAMEFCRRLTARAREGGSISEYFEYRLPTEAEWEFCCRAGASTERYGELDKIALHRGIGRNMTCGIDDGSFESNAWGLHHTLGNVFEWCLDVYGSYAPNNEGAFYRDRPNFVPFSDPAPRVVRGGSWADSAKYARAAARRSAPPEMLSSRIGFRVVLARCGDFRRQ